MKAVAVFALLASVASPSFATNAAFEKWANDLADDTMRANPAGATVAQYFEGDEQDALDRLLTPNTKAYRSERVAKAKQALAELAAFDRSDFDSEQKVSAMVIEWTLRRTVDSAKFEDYNFVFRQFHGLHERLVSFLTHTHPIRNKRDIENYIARLGQVAGQIDEGISQARDAASRGILMPDFITRSSLGQFERFLSNPPEQNVFVTSLKERAAKLSDVSNDDQAAFVADATRMTAEQVIPAFKRAQALLERQLPDTTSDAGLWRFPDGAEAYANALRNYTTTDMSPEEIHELGLSEVAHIEKRMDGLLRELGFTDGSINERMKALNASLQPPSEPDPRPELLEKYEALLADALKRSADVFDVRPKAPCEVKREPAFTEKTAAAHYSGPAPDGSRPGTFWVPLPGPTYKITGMRTLTYHEAIPGHHFQIALQRETESLPKYRRNGIFSGGSAYSEGWALYAEQLAAENNWYEGDKVGLLGQLDGELMRARRLVVDTGLHAKHWTRQQVIDYGIDASEAERYTVWPGQACAYKVGQLKILALRTKAKAALGDRFSIKEFHNTILLNGNVPLDVLEQIIDEWIASKS